MVKAWTKNIGLKMNSLAIEVLVLNYMPRPHLFQSMSYTDALAGFFEAAAKARVTRIKDSAGCSGNIDPSIDFGKLRTKLADAHRLSRAAVEAETAWRSAPRLLEAPHHAPAQPLASAAAHPGGTRTR
jgi:hypothetical protein